MTLNNIIDSAVVSSFHHDSRQLQKPGGDGCKCAALFPHHPLLGCTSRRGAGGSPSGAASTQVIPAPAQLNKQAIHRKHDFLLPSLAAAPAGRPFPSSTPVAQQPQQSDRLSPQPLGPPLASSRQQGLGSGVLPTEEEKCPLSEKTGKLP